MRRLISLSCSAFWKCLVLFFVALAIPYPVFAQGDSITLPEALKQALARNPSLASLLAQRQALEARVWEARSGYFPQLSVVAGYTQYQEPNIVIPIHERGIFPPLDDQIYETGFQLKMPLFNGGRTVANTRAADAYARESYAQEGLARFGVMEGVGRIFVQARQLRDNQSLVTARINSLRRRYREMSLLLEEGRVSPADLALVNASIESALADSVDIGGKGVELAYHLGRLLGAGGPIRPEIVGIDTNDADDRLKPLFIPDTSESAGPKMDIARAQLARAEAAKAVAAGSFWPEISAFAAYNYRSGGDLDLIGEWAAGFALRFPLFEGGRRIAGRNAASATVRAAEKRLESVRQEEESSLQIELEQLKSARVRRGHIARALEDKATSVSAQQEMYRAGRVSLSDVLVQETELLQLNIQERALAYAEILALLNYHSIAGTLSADMVQEIVRSKP